MQSKYLSVEQEKQIAHKLGGRIQSNSGGTKFGGGDVHTESFLIEAKTPTKTQTSFSIKKDWIDKAKEQAYEQNKYHSALAFRFDPQGVDYYVIDETLMKVLVNLLDKEAEE